jgi:splicing factor U2AF 65 kDa subunit
LKRAGGVLEPGNPVIKTFLNPEKRFVFIDFRSVEEAMAFLQLDGIRFGGVNLRIRWTEDYEKLGAVKPKKPVPKIDTVALGIISTKVEEGPLKVFIGGLPKELTEEQIKNLLLNYGRLKSFHLVKDNKDLMTSRGFAFCEFTDERGVSNAIKFLNGLKICNR